MCDPAYRNTPESRKVEGIFIGLIGKRTNKVPAAARIAAIRVLAGIDWVLALIHRNLGDSTYPFSQYASPARRIARGGNHNKKTLALQGLFPSC
jgi:hypothetical protein